jgi:CubicO group peptidase (beta-lactamase class C family)
MRSLAVIAAFLLTLSITTQPVSAQRRPPNDDAKAVDRIMNAAMKAWQIPGAAVAVVKNDRVVYVQGYGTTDLTGTKPVTPDTLFQIASTSKAFTSTALAMLASDGKLSFDDPVRKHVDYFRLEDPCADAQVTIRDILSHRTGLKRHDWLWDNTEWTREDVVRKMGQVELTKPFRTSYQYQNIMFIAAGEVVTKASGMPWEEFMRTRIFQPLGMTRTAITDKEWEAAEHAGGHRYDWRTGTVTPHRHYDTTTIGAGGAIKSSARDMAQWLRFQLADGAHDITQFVDPALLDETKTPHTVIRVEGYSRDANPETNVMSYGLGWVIQDYRGEMLISHSGSLNGFRTHVDLLPRRESGFVVMGNVGRSLALVALRNSLADHLTGKNGRDWNAYYLMVERNADEKEARERDESLAKRVAGTTHTLPLAQYAGVYENPAYGTATITVLDGNLVLQWSRITTALSHFHYDVFRAESKSDDLDEEVTFELDAKRDLRGLKLFGEKFTKKQEPKPALKKAS